MRKLLILLLTLCSVFVFSEAPRVLRAPVWIYLEEVPGSFENPNPEQLPLIEEINEIARFILSGMVGGWNFSYVPGDRKRNIQEDFVLETVQDIQRNDPQLIIDSLKPAYPKLTCWAQFTIDEAAARRLDYWDSIRFRPAKGRGIGERVQESNGIRDAYTNAVLHAVRSLARRLEKNKPKEIRGEVLLREGPRLFANAGQFVAEVQVLVNIREIIPYTLY